MLGREDARYIITERQKERDGWAEILRELRNTRPAGRDILLEIARMVQERNPSVTVRGLRRQMRAVQNQLDYVSKQLTKAFPHPRYIGEDDRLSADLKFYRTLLQEAERMAVQKLCPHLFDFYTPVTGNTHFKLGDGRRVSIVPLRIDSSQFEVMIFRSVIDTGFLLKNTYRFDELPELLEKLRNQEI